jgi:hypothetical protein
LVLLQHGTGGACSNPWSCLRALWKVSDPLDHHTAALHLAAVCTAAISSSACGFFEEMPMLCMPHVLRLHLITPHRNTPPSLQLEEIKAARGLNVDDGTAAADKPLAEVLAERKKAKQDAFDEQWRQMKTGGGCCHQRGGAAAH